ncbi:MAG: hypothetical protein H7X95_10625, partial [Deltaproteobacteria bacterium]|nr:hypothetical protein [Deltaproteobacteria bacterium]
MERPLMMDTTKIRARVGSWRASFEEQLAALVEIPTVSMDPGRRADMDRCAALAKQLLTDTAADANVHVDVIETPGHPLVLGRVVRDPSFPTVTIYNHLDVQPADAAEWRT